jgi:multiple sugar transport system ATP-binding protein
VTRAGPAPGLALRGIAKVYPGGVAALRGVSLEAARGELLAVVGPSGCGKSTLLRLVAGLEEPSAGELEIDGAPAAGLSPRARDVALVFPAHSLFPHLSAAENMGYGLRLRGAPRDEVSARVRDAARALGLEGLLERRPAQLSSGERQRVALGRALVRRPRLLLLDEPLSSLDAHLRGDLRREIVRVHRRLDAVTLFVTHDQAEAASVGDRVAVLDRGSLEQVGAPAALREAPANRFVAAFFGVPAASFLEGRLVAQEGRLLFEHAGLRLDVPEAWKGTLGDGAPRAVAACVRPDDWRWADAGAADRGEALR